MGNGGSVRFGLKLGRGGKVGMIMGRNDGRGGLIENPGGIDGRGGLTDNPGGSDGRGNVDPNGKPLGPNGKFGLLVQPGILTCGNVTASADCVINSVERKNNERTSAILIFWTVMFL